MKIPHPLKMLTAWLLPCIVFYLTLYVLTMKFLVTPENQVPDELVAKVKKLIRKDGLKASHVELRFNQRLTTCAVIDVETFEVIARYNSLNVDLTEVKPEPEDAERTE